MSPLELPLNPRKVHLHKLNNKVTKRCNKEWGKVPNPS